MTDTAWAETSRILQSIRSEWAVAEEDIKLAEQICRKVSFPSIKELRYAGRKVVEVVYLVSTSADVSEIESLLRDILRDCHRARHDAIDAGSAQISMEVALIAKRLGYSHTLVAFPDFSQLHDRLNRIREKIAESRKNTATRDVVYTDIEQNEFPELVALYRRFLAAQPLIRRLALAEKRQRAIIIVLGVIETCVLLDSIIEHWRLIVATLRSAANAIH